MIRVLLPGYSKDANVNSVSVFMSVYVPLIVSLVAINTHPMGLPFLSLLAMMW